MKVVSGWAKSRAILVAATMVVTGCQVLFGDFQFTPMSSVGGNGSISGAGASSLPTTCDREGDLRCNGAVLDRCVSKAWKADLDCGNAAQCDAQNGRCKLCVPNAFRCEAFRLMQCTSNGENWTLVKGCDTEAACDAANGRCATCSTDQAICYQGLLQVCNAERTSWDVTDCGNINRCRTSFPPGCGSCTPNSYQCNDKTLQRCNDQQEWVTVDECASAALCTQSLSTKADVESKGQTWPGKCEAPICKTGEFRCNPDNKAQLQTCPPSQLNWENISPTCLVADLCDPIAGKCKDGCAPGSYKCDGARLLYCGANGQYETTPAKVCATAAQCSATKHDCLACKTGDFQCDGAKLQQCNQSQTWDTLGVCTTAALCDASINEGRKDCKPAGCTTPNTQRCDPQHLNVLQSCPATQLGWTTLGTCETAALCNADRTTCITPTCNVGETRCSGQNHQVCNSDRTGWTIDKTCPANQVCDLQKGCATCTLGQQRCNGASIEVCNPDPTTQLLTWQSLGKTCPTKELCKVVNNIASCDTITCSVGEHDCTSSGALNICNVGRNGWDPVQTCTADKPICDENGGQCDACTPKTYSCYGSTLRRCSDDGQSYVPVQDNCVECSVSSDKLSGSCYVCQTSSKRCSGANQIEACSTDRKSWASPTTCANGYSCVAVDGQNDYCATCPVAGEVACVQTGSPGSTHKCSADRKSWSATTTCTQGFGCVSVNPGDDYCASACSPNEIKCADGTSVHTCDSQGKGWGPTTTECASSTSLKSCSAGVLSSTSSVACPSNIPNCDAGRCVACTGTTSSCANATTSQACQDGNWMPSPCGSNKPYCVGSGTCVECTSSNAPTCPTTTSRRYCSANVWTTAPCATGTTCLSGECVECTSSSMPTCADDTTRRVCVGTSWVPEVCSDPAFPKCNNGACSECNDATESTCQSDSVRKYCVNGTFTTETCNGTCSQGKCVDCKLGDAPSCSGTQAKKCVNNTWEFTSCTGTTPVCAGGACVECLNTQSWICDANDPTLLRQCVGNSWETRHCSAPTGYCLSGACVACLPDNTGCDTNHVCDSGVCVPRTNPDAGVGGGGGEAGAGAGADAG